MVLSGRGAAHADRVALGVAVEPVRPQLQAVWSLAHSQGDLVFGVDYFYFCLSLYFKANIYMHTHLQVTFPYNFSS